jgi:hypothetical protein
MTQERPNESPRFDPGTLLGDLQSPGHRRESLGAIRRALRSGWITPWTISPVMYANLPNLVGQAVLDAAKTTDKDGNPRKRDVRTVMMGASILRQFAADNARLIEMLDEAERLDRGDATLRVGTDAKRQERDLSNKLSADPEARKAIALLADKLGPALAEAERLAAEPSIEDLASRVVGDSPAAEPRA